ncbi:hypothetical protein Tco_1352779 [Tanacetum coccineum]
MSYCSTAVECVVYKRVEGVEVSVITAPGPHIAATNLGCVTDSGIKSHGYRELRSTILELFHLRILSRGCPTVVAQAHVLPLSCTREPLYMVYFCAPEHWRISARLRDKATYHSITTSFLAYGLTFLVLVHWRVEMRDIASVYYHSLHLSGTPPLLPIPLPAPSTSHRADIPEADMPPRKRLLLLLQT